MQEHAIELVSILASFAVALVTIILWFIKRDRKSIDSSIAGIRIEIDRLRTDMEGEIGKAMQKVNQVEHNYVDRFIEVKDAISDLGKDMAELFGELKATLAKEYVSKDEMRENRK